MAARGSGCKEALSVGADRVELEEHLDVIADDFVSGLEQAGEDDEAAREVIAECIEAFYDVREDADQIRGSADAFFLADGVGLDDTGRPVPLARLRTSQGDAFAERISKLFTEVAPDVE